MTVVIISVVVLLILIALRMPIGAVMAFVGFVGILAVRNFDQAINVFYSHSYYVVSSYSLVVIPLFIIMGHWALYSGIAHGFFDFAHKLLGRLPGGLALATIAGCAGFAAATGSSVATAGTMGKIAVPEMRRRGYDPKLTCGTVAAGGTLGVLIPPSGIGVIYAYITGLSTSKVLLAGLIPGIVSGIIYMIMVFLRVKMNPALAPKATAASWRQIVASSKGAVGLMLVVVIVLGGIYSGVMTVTEAGAAGAFFCFILPIATRSMSWKDLKLSLFDTVEMMSMLFLLVIGTSIYTVFISVSGIPMQISQWIIALEVPRIIIFLCLLLLYLPLGMFLDSISLILLTMPIIFPTLQQLGYDGIWFGVILVKVIEVGLITPPVGMNVFVVKSVVPDVPLEDIFRGIWPFLLMDLATIALLIAFPQISLWLPSTM